MIMDKKDNAVIQWLKNIFSIKVFSFIVALIALWISYLTFVKDNPGELTFFCDKVQCNSNITRLYYGFEMKGDSVDIVDLPSFMHIGNLTSSPIEDATIIVSMPNIAKITVNRPYMQMVEEKQYEYPRLTLGMKMERIGAMSVVPFPIKTIHFDNRELLNFTIQFAYVNKGHKESRNMYITIVGLPTDKSKNGIESSFIETIRPQLLSDNNPDGTVIVFNNEIVESPTNYSLLKGAENKICNIIELKK